jgi:hypothetical protein
MTTAFLAVRNPPEPPVLPEDPQGVLNEWCGQQSVVLLRCDLGEQILSTHGNLEVIEIGSERDVQGLNTAAVLGRLVKQHGNMTVSAGPSGFIADSMVSFSHTESEEGLQLRVIVERLEDAVVVYIGRQGSGQS